MSRCLDAHEILARASGDAFLGVIAQYTNKPDFVTRKPGEGREYATRCPLGCGSRHDALRLWPDKLPTAKWWCRRCGESGDILAFVQKARRLSFPAAIGEVARLLGDPAVMMPSNQKAPSQEYMHVADTDMSAWQLSAGIEARKCLDKLFSEKFWIKRNYLLSRGLTEKTLRAARIGYQDEVLDMTPKKWGLPNTGRYSMPTGWTIPYLDQGGTVTAMKVRLDPVLVVNGKPIPYKHLSRGHAPASAYGKFTCNGQYVTVLQESELDALLGWQFAPEFAWLATPAGSHLHKCDRPPGILVVGMDDDDAGLAAIATHSTDWPDAIIAPPFDGAKDLSDLYQKRGSQAVADWIDEVRSLARAEVAY